MNIFFQLFLSFFKLGFIMFGGGYAMLPILEHEVIDRRGWMTEEEILDLYALAQCTPGVIAVNTATKTGYKVKGTLGALCATVGVVTPSLIIIIAISMLLENLSAIQEVQNILSGIRVASCAMMMNTLIKLGKAGIKDWFGAVLFVSALVASVIFNISPMWLVLIAIFAGIGYGRIRKGAD